jgi:hypothetical protein
LDATNFSRAVFLVVARGAFRTDASDACIAATRADAATRSGLGSETRACAGSKPTEEVVLMGVVDPSGLFFGSPTGPVRVPRFGLRDVAGEDPSRKTRPARALAALASRMSAAVASASASRPGTGPALVSNVFGDAGRSKIAAARRVSGVSRDRAGSRGRSSEKRSGAAPGAADRGRRAVVFFVVAARVVVSEKRTAAAALRAAGGLCAST